MATTTPKPQGSSWQTPHLCPNCNQRSYVSSNAYGWWTCCHCGKQFKI